MKPYQFYTVTKMPILQPGQCVKKHVQLTFFGEGEDVETKVTMERERYEANFALMRVESSVRHQTFGYIRTFIDSKKRKIGFSEYLQPVDFPAYYDKDKQIIIFQAPKKDCRGVLAHLRDKTFVIELEELKVDFVKLSQIHSEYLGAWFRGVSSRVQSAGLSGHQIQDDLLFQRLSAVGQLSNVTIPWQFSGVEHSVMITNMAAIVLVQNYQNNIGFELQLVMDVYDKILKKVWYQKKLDKRTNIDKPQSNSSD